MLALVLAGQVHAKAELFELYSNFDISHLIRTGMSWYDLLDIRQQLRRPTLAFYVDKVQYKARMNEVGIDIPEIYYSQNADRAMTECAFARALRSIEDALAGRSDYVAKPTHMSCSDDVHVVKDGWNIYPTTPWLVNAAQVAATLAKGLRTHSSLQGESWALHQVPPGVMVEERISAGGGDDTAALEFKTIVIWGRVWAAEVRTGTRIVQVLGRDGRGLLDKSLHPSLAHVEWPRVRSLAETLGAHKDCFRVDIFASPSATRKPSLGSPERAPPLKYLLNEVEFYITSSMPMFDDAARLWLEGYNSSRYVSIPNSEVSGRYADMRDPALEEELSQFARLRSGAGLSSDFLFSAPRTYGSLAPRRDAMEESQCAVGDAAADGEDCVA
jgi:hypothetical protein